ncbi:hypothetical protein MesoLjLc_77170 [Mesorhizobium sp. L-8-10]|nr:hypothetical protein MesoLjLc_77170 [Mesorhizobium sp. L-8-10]
MNPALSLPFLDIFSRRSEVSEVVSATRVLWGQIIVVFTIVLVAVWAATQWTAWRLGFQGQLGSPWFEVAGLPLYPPPAFFWWWYFFDAYAPHVFMEGGAIAASGSFIAIAVADRALLVRP